MMVNTAIGEIINIQHVTSRADPKNLESLRHTFKRLKRLIGANFKVGKSELWVTLTYHWADKKNKMHQKSKKSGHKNPTTKK